MDELKNVTKLSEAQARRAKRTDKFVLPELPAVDDVAGQCAWLTTAFALDPAHPITGGRREGLHGPLAHVVLDRAGTSALEFEPATKLNTPAKLIETLSWYLLPSDSPLPAFKGEHCRLIVHVIRQLCATAGAMTAVRQIDMIVSAYVHAGIPIEGRTTHGTTGQRYEAAMALRRTTDENTGRAVGPARYLTDANTGEFVVPVAELQDAARHYVGSSLARGWLDARMEAFGWERIELQGYGQPDDQRRRGPHARVYAYRGLLPRSEDG